MPLVKIRFRAQEKAYGRQVRRKAPSTCAVRAGWNPNRRFFRRRNKQKKVGVRLAVHLLLISKLVFVLKKKPTVGKYAGKLRPLAPCGRDGIQIVDFFGGGTSKKR